MFYGKKTAAVILATIIAFAALATGTDAVTANESTASAQNVSGDYEYNILDDATVEITKYTGKNTDVVIPSEINGTKVTKINKYAFSGNSSLENVTIPDSVTEIGDQAFVFCGSTSINVDKNNTAYSSQDGILYNKDKTELIRYPKRKRDKEYKILDSVTIIGNYAFEGCLLIENVTIPDSVTEIGRGAFTRSCIISANIPKSVIYIGWNAFEQCTSLTDINVDNNNTAYSSLNGVFFNKDKTELICCPAGKTDKEYSVPDGVTKIGDHAFEYCFLTSVTLPDSVTTIDISAFYGCMKLEKINIPDSVTSIGTYAFYGCENLKSIEIPKSVKTISNHAFGYISDSSISDITIYGYTGSAAMTYANKNGLNFIEIDSQSITDKSTNISINGFLPTSSRLKISGGNVSGKTVTYDIKITDKNGDTVQSIGEMTVSIPCDTPDCKVFEVSDDGTKTDLNAKYNDGCYVFTTSRLLSYEIDGVSSESGDTLSSSPSDDNGSADNTVITVAIVAGVIFLAAVTLLVIVFLRKRRAR